MAGTRLCADSGDDLCARAMPCLVDDCGMPFGIQLPGPPSGEGIDASSRPSCDHLALMDTNPSVKLGTN